MTSPKVETHEKASVFGEIHDKVSEMYNNLSFEDRRDKAGLGYSLAQHTTIVQMRFKNKEAWKRQDRELADWQRNVERSLEGEYLTPTPGDRKKDNE